jgi:hypothetical protein
MEEEKKRHGCLTAWLVLIIIFDLIFVALYFFFSEFLVQSRPSLPLWSMPAMVILVLFDLACVIALFRWKRWGFWGMCCVTNLAAAVNIALGMRIDIILEGFIGIIVVFILLQIGKKSGWEQLD